MYTMLMVICVSFLQAPAHSSVLVLGGLTSRYEVSDELWQFNISTGDWTSLTSAVSVSINWDKSYKYRGCGLIPGVQSTYKM